MFNLPKEYLPKIWKAVEEDDVDKFRKFLADEKEMVNWHTYTEVLSECIDQGAKKCALVLIRGDFPEPDGKPPFTHFSPDILIDALSLPNCDYDVVEAMIKEGGCVPHVNQPLLAFLPLQIHIANIVEMHPLSEWSAADDSLIKLIILLCDPKLKPSLNVARLLAEYTHAINDVAYSLFMNEDLMDLAALLLVSHPRVLEHLSEVTVLPKVIQGKSAGFGLLRIFEKAGDNLSKFHTSMEKDISLEDMVRGVAAVIRDANLPITHKDVDLSKIYSFEPNVVASICESLDLSMEVGIDQSKKPVYPSAHIPIPKLGVPFNPEEFLGPIIPLSGGKPHNYQDVRQYSSATRFYRTSVSRRSWSSPSSRSAAILALKLKRGMRFL